MPCTHCPHCQESEQRRELRLPDPPAHGAAGRDGVNLGFYLAFARAYDRARAMGSQPMRRLREVNPWLTPSRCREYLKRARAAGLVTSPPRVRAAEVTTVGQGTVGQGDGVAPVERVPDLFDLDPVVVELWTRRGRPVTVRAVLGELGPSGTMRQARALVDATVRAGFATPADDDDEAVLLTP